MKIMKKVIFVLFYCVIWAYGYSQIDSRRGFQYLTEFSDTNMLYTDIVCSNYDSDPWPAVGINRCERAVHYSYSSRCGESLSMISVHTDLSAIEYSEFFIYDVFQNLTYYVYSTEETELIFHIENKEMILVRENGRDKFGENYFLSEPENYFNYPEVIARSVAQLKMCLYLSGIPDYNKELDSVRDLYKRINSLTGLRRETKGEFTGFYDGNDLVKIVVKTDIIKEYYLNENQLAFAYYTGNDETQELRLYCKGNYMFRLLFGKENLAKTSEEFWDKAEVIRDEFFEALALFK